MFDELFSEIESYFLTKYPKEACGLIIEREGAPAFAKCANIVSVSDACREFEIGSADLRRYASLLAVVHSHPDGLRCPSARDMDRQMETAVPWGIVRTGRGMAETPFWFGDQVPTPLLIGRSFRHGVTDCYSLIRDWYRVERGVTLENFPRDWKWWRKDAKTDLYGKNFKRAGFRMLRMSETPSKGDLAFFKIRSEVVNHAGVLCEPEVILHHLSGESEYSPDRFSVREPLSRWLPRVQYWVRYEG